ncbi:MAG: hypothetical protein V3W09_04145 [Nitrososphaerales archaeon]
MSKDAEEVREEDRLIDGKEVSSFTHEELKLMILKEIEDDQVMRPRWSHQQMIDFVLDYSVENKCSCDPETSIVKCKSCLAVETLDSIRDSLTKTAIDLGAMVHERREEYEEEAELLRSRVESESFRTVGKELKEALKEIEDDQSTHSHSSR